MDDKQQPDPVTSPPAMVRRMPGRTAALLLGGGVLAWIIALAAVVVAMRSADQDQPSVPDAPPQVADLPTLAAATHTPVPTTITPTDTVTPTATATDVPAAALTPTRTPTVMSPGAPTVTPIPLIALATGTATPDASSTDASSTDASSTDVAEPDPAEGEADASGVEQAQACAPPDGWERYVVQPDDTLFAFVLGAENTVTVDDLVAANCLGSRYLSIGQVLYLPPGSAENAPPSQPYVAPEVSGQRGPRAANCPCTISISVGWRREQVADAITASETMFTGADFLAVTGPGASAPFDFVMDRPAGASLEGFLFPGTYTVQNDTTAEQFRDMMLNEFAANVSSQMRADAAAQGVTFYQALIIASIVQREVRGPETQKLVASVYHNRYRDGNRMGTVVAVQYALGGPGNWWPRVTASGLEVDSLYNTYTRSGLPPGPIDSPGLSAIVAAVYPAQTEYRYHTASCDGTGEVFAVTYEEHLANVNCD